MRQVLTLRELGDRFGVDVGQIKRLVRVGSLPEAIKENSPSGKRWVIPVNKVDDIARRHGWEANEIDLDAESQPAVSFARSSQDSVNQHGTSVHNGQRSGPDLPNRSDTLVTAPTNQVDLRSNTSASTGESQLPSPSPMSLTPLRPPTDLQPPLPPDNLKVKRREPEVSAVPALSEILNEDLLDRLLGAHEDKATAQARVRETERALTSLTASHRHVSMQLSEERKEREILADRLREERNARLQSDAKVAELHQRVARETAIAEAEQRARQAATDRSIKAERDTATALGSMGVVSRRKYERRAKKRG